jgi:DNA polymerase-3 subunit alpha
VLQPDVNESTLRFAAVGNDIRFGMGAVRNVGANVVESIMKSRKEKGKYSPFADFLDKSELVACNKRVIESLIKAGGFDSLGNTRLLMIQVHEDAVEAVVPLKRQQAMGQFDLFGSMGDSDDDGVAASSSSPLAHLKFGDEEYPRKQLLAYEREMLGLLRFRPPARRRRADPAQARAEADRRDPRRPAEGGEVVISGLITALEIGGSTRTVNPGRSVPSRTWTKRSRCSSLRSPTRCSART